MVHDLWHDVNVFYVLFLFILLFGNIYSYQSLASDNPAEPQEILARSDYTGSGQEMVMKEENLITITQVWKKSIRFPYTSYPWLIPYPQRFYT